MPAWSHRCVRVCVCACAWVCVYGLVGLRAHDPFFRISGVPKGFDPARTGVWPATSQAGHLLCGGRYTCRERACLTRAEVARTLTAQRARRSCQERARSSEVPNERLQYDHNIHHIPSKKKHIFQDNQLEVKKGGAHGGGTFSASACQWVKLRAYEPSYCMATVPF